MKFRWTKWLFSRPFAAPMATAAFLVAVLAWGPSPRSAFAFGTESKFGIAVLETADREPTILVALPDKGEIRRIDPSVLNSGAKVDVTQAGQPVVSDLPIGRPTAIAADYGNLIVCDMASGRIVELDPTTGHAILLHTDFALKEPESVAVSRGGLIAVADDQLDKVIVFKRHLADRTQLELVGSFDADEVKRLAFNEEQLFGFDRTKNRLVTFYLQSGNGGQSPVETEDNAVRRVNSVLKFDFDNVRLRDFAIRNGAFYLFSDAGLICVMPDVGVSRSDIRDNSVIVRSAADLNVDRFAASKDELYGLAGGKELVSVSRPVPVSVRVELPDESDLRLKKKTPLRTIITQQSASLVSLYWTLHRQGLLRTRQIRLKRDFESPQSLLKADELDQDLLLNRPAPVDGVPEDEAYYDNIAALICEINGQECRRADKRRTWRLREGDLVMVPAFDVIKSYKLIGLTLEGRTVRERLSELLSPEQIGAFTTKRLLILNKELGQDEETLMSYSDKNARVLLPTTVWRISVWLPSRDLRAVPKPQDSIESTPGMSVDSQEIAVRTSLSAETLGVQIDEVFEWGAYRRNQLLSLNYGNLFRSSMQTGVHVGVYEDRNSIFGHAAMKDVWFEHVGIDQFVPVAAFNTTPQNVRADGHGLHVGGIIASRSEELPGLIPGAELILIDSDVLNSAAKITTAFTEAASSSEGVSVFNISGKFDSRMSVETFNGLQRAMTTGMLSRCLFVVAAGNDGVSLKDAGIFPAIWSAEANNIITVGGTNEQDSLLREYPFIKPDGTPGKEAGSNFGQKWVQLLAPSFEIPSLGSSQDGYKKMTGTSQAAAEVSAAAATLYSLLNMNSDIPASQIPERTKLRLIYTSTWRDEYQGQAWGGRVDFDRAVGHLKETIVTTNTTRSYALKLKKSQKLRVTNTDLDSPGACSAYEVNDFTSQCDETIAWSDVLRLEKAADGKYRIVFLQSVSGGGKPTKRLRILLDAKLDGISLPVTELFEIDNASGAIDRNFNQAETTEIKITDIQNYVRAMPTELTLVFQ